MLPISNDDEDEVIVTKEHLKSLDKQLTKDTNLINEFIYKFEGKMS
jgi:hypothetical protein